MVPPRHLEKPRVLYLCGWGRSGTTIIDQVLGEVPGFTSVGELRSLWDTDPATHKCGCGQVVNRCPLWGPLLRAMEQASGYTMEDVASLRDEVARTRHLPRLSAAARRNGHGRASRAATESDFHAFAKTLFYGSEYTLSYNRDPRRLLGTSVKASRRFSAAELLKNLV